MSRFVVHLSFSQQDLGKVTQTLNRKRPLGTPPWKATVTGHFLWTVRSQGTRVHSAAQPCLVSKCQAERLRLPCLPILTGDPGQILSSSLSFSELRRAGLRALGLPSSFIVFLLDLGSLPSLCFSCLICMTVIMLPTSQGCMWIQGAKAWTGLGTVPGTW